VLKFEQKKPIFFVQGWKSNLGIIRNEKYNI